MRSVITLLTDFGVLDTYVGQVKGAIATVNPDAQVVDLTHGIAPQDVRAGAFALECAVTPFSPQAVHLAVVDPGVGTSRAGIAVRSAAGTFVGPDNGLLSVALPARARPDGHGPARVAVPQGVSGVRLAEPRWWRTPLSATFHGRDIFAPVAAHLAAGVALEEFGPPLESLLAFPAFRAYAGDDGALHTTVIAIDRFGNVITGCRAGQTGPRLTVTCNGYHITGLQTAYGDAAGLIAVVSSCGYIELALPGGSAAAAIGARVGDIVMVRPLDGE